jgi:NMD protein affecting ribosome stability and mRNA decay
MSFGIREATDKLRLLIGVPETIAVEHCSNCGALKNLSRASRPLSGRADQ